MGRASRWLRSLWGSNKKDHKADKENSSNFSNNEERKEKKRWSFGKPARDSREHNAASVEAALFRSFYNGNDEEQSRHAIAVAAATAAAADAAVAAAQAAVEVVRLTSKGRGGHVGPGNYRERAAAAVAIQTAFRAFLARKAFRALRALVKLQALVRGYLVRKQAAATFHSMQALIQAQSSVRAHRSRSFAHRDRRIQPEIRPHRSLERFDENRSDMWLSVHSRRFSTGPDSTSSSFDRSPKIVEIDTVRPKSRSSRRTTSPSVVDSGEETHQNSIPSPLRTQVPNRLSIPDYSRNVEDFEWCLTSEKCRLLATAHSTPRYINLCNNVPSTPARSVCGPDGAFRHTPNGSNCPGYMSNTQSFEAKVRSQSAPKQRPDPSKMRKRVPLSEMMIESRASISGGIQRPCPKLQEPFNFKSAIIGRIDGSNELLVKEIERNFYLDRKW